MILSVSRVIGAALLLAVGSLAADCQTATVGSPYSTCYDIYTAAKITAAQLTSYNPGLDCSKLQIGQKLCISSGTLPSDSPKPNPDGSCATYTTISGDYCALIATKFSITTAQIEAWNAGTYKWKGCASLQLGYTLCVSSGTPPPIPVNPDLQCGPESKGNATCPLKACCSAYGYCGTTDEFCKAAPNGDPCISNCFQPTLPSCSSSKLTRTVGYYAGWANRRKCDKVSSKQVDLTGFTHVLFAFATIGNDMKIALSSDDVPLLNDLVSRKGSARILIAVGGWAFSQEGSDKALFTTMISTSANRATFIASVKTFLSTYKLDGIDIDMEYPASTERGGPPSDTPNLTAFFKELRTALPSADISLATPSGYWFLKGFELDKIAPSVSFINMMSYDYHGPWDTTVNGANSSALPQTSLDDIKESVLLYTRVVNLGIAWYGRTYALKSSSCNSYGCAMTGGGTKGECTDASGVLSYSEISRLIGKNTVNYDKVGQTKWFKNGGDLITYDDKDTWAAKKDFAAKTCFGGTMVWSMDQVDPPASTTPTPGKPCTEASTWAKDYVTLEMKHFFTQWTPPTPVPVGPSIPGGCGCYPKTDNLWHEVTALEGVVNYMMITGDNQYKDHVTSASFAFTDGATAILMNSGSFHESHDDALWTVLLYFKIDEWLAKIGKADSRYWDAGIRILSWTGEGRTDSRDGSTSACNGGVWWEGSGSSKKGYKNAITNELYIAASVKAYLKTNTKSYLDDATTAWKFLKDKMKRGSSVSQPGLYSDGTSLPDCTNNMQETWTYNQGVVLHALGLLYKATGDHSYVDEALVTLDAVIKYKTKDNILAEGCDLPGNTCNFDQTGFKGLFMRHLQYFLELVNDSAVTAKYSDWIGLQARAMNQYARRSDGEVGSIWWGTTSAAIYPDAVNAFSSGVDAVLASVKFGTLGMSWNQGGGYNQQGYGPNNGQWNAGPNQWQGAGGQYPPPSQPYAAPQVNPPVVGFSDYKAKTDEYGERFKPKSRVNDIPFLILFIAQFLGFVAVSGIALHSWVSNNSLSSGGVGGSRQGGTNVTLNSHTVYLLLLVTAAALVFSTIYLLLVRTFTNIILQVTLVLSVAANIAIAVYYWVTKYYSGAIIFTIIAVFGVLAYFGMRSRIPLASLMLQVVIDVSKHHKSVYIVAFSGLIAQAALSVWFIFTAIATYAKWTPNNATCQNGSSCSSGTVTGLIFFELFSYLWTSQVIGNVCLATMAGGPYGGWYYFGPSNMGQMPKNPSLSAFARASTLSLGSIAFGSLIVTLLELLRIILNMIRANAAESGSPVEAALACCAACFVGCIESMVEYFNRYAYIEIALYGKPYIPAAKDTWRLFKDRGIDALINDSLTGIAMTWGAYLVGLLCSLFAYVYLRLTNPAYNADGQYTAPVLLFAFLIGLQCSLTLASAIEAGVSTIFVGLGEDPQVLAERSPGLFAMIREHYPDVVHPVV